MNLYWGQKISYKDFIFRLWLSNKLQKLFSLKIKIFGVFLLYKCIHMVQVWLSLQTKLLSKVFVEYPVLIRTIQKYKIFYNNFNRLSETQSWWRILEVYVTSIQHLRHSKLLYINSLIPNIFCKKIHMWTPQRSYFCCSQYVSETTAMSW